MKKKLAILMGSFCWGIMAAAGGCMDLKTMSPLPEDHKQDHKRKQFAEKNENKVESLKEIVTSEIKNVEKNYSIICKVLNNNEKLIKNNKGAQEYKNRIEKLKELHVNINDYTTKEMLETAIRKLQPKPKYINEN